MKRVLLLILIVLGVLNMRAEGDGSTISLHGSFSVPLGDYGSKEYQKGSFTTPGVSFGAEGVWNFKYGIGFGIDVNYSLHPVDVIALATEMVNNDPFLTNVVVRSDPYSILTISGGIYYSVNLSDKLELQPKLLLGIMFGKTPFQLFEPTYFIVGPEYFKITSSRDQGLTYRPGISLRYSVSSCVSLNIRVNYTYSDLSFGFITSQGKEYRDKSISFLDFGLGLVIHL